MHNMFNENADHLEILRRFPSLLGCRSQLDLNGGRCPKSINRSRVPGSFSNMFDQNPPHFIDKIVAKPIPVKNNDKASP